MGLAAFQGHEKVVAVLLEHRVDAAAVANEQRHTVLDIAVKAGHPGVINVKRLNLTLQGSMLTLQC